MTLRFKDARLVNSHSSAETWLDENERVHGGVVDPQSLALEKRENTCTAMTPDSGAMPVRNKPAAFDASNVAPEEMPATWVPWKQPAAPSPGASASFSQLSPASGLTVSIGPPFGQKLIELFAALVTEKHTEPVMRPANAGCW
jgi:hypothetical protein